MDEFRGKIPVFEPISELFTKPDHRFLLKEELHHFKKPFKEFDHVPLKPVTPVFKRKIKAVDEEYESEVESAFEDDEYEETEGFGECEYEEEEEEGEDDEEELDIPFYEELEVQAVEVPPNFGSPPTLIDLCLSVLARNFETMWKYVKYIPETNLKTFSKLMDLEKTDVGLAARAINEDHFWKRWTFHRWPGYHRPWAHGGSFKTHFLQKFLAETISAADPASCNMRTLLRLTRRVKRWIYALDIRQLSATQWPAAVDVESSSDSDAFSQDNLISDMSLSEYLTRRINFFPTPASTNRLDLEPICRLLRYLTHLTICFGFDNYALHRDARFSVITDEDALNLSKALGSCTSLYCFKLNRSKVTPKQLETIVFGLNDLEFFREADFSSLFLTDEHMVSLSGLLLMKINMKSLSLKNNHIGSEGLIRLLHVIVLKDCRLQVLDVSMNPIGDPGGVAMASLLAKKKRFIKRVSMSGTELTHVSGYNFGVVLYFNKCLEVLNLSVNQFNEFAAESLLRGLAHNYTLKRIDVRECGINFTTVREMERICYRNAELDKRNNKITYPAIVPTDYWSGFTELDDDEAIDESIEEDVTNELLQIFSWATNQMKPKTRVVLLRDIHAFMKKTNFVTRFSPIIEDLILLKQKEILYRARIEFKREKEERNGSSLVDFSMQEFIRRSSEKTKADFSELEALNLLKDVNRCGRIDDLFKSVKPEKIDGILRYIGHSLDSDEEKFPKIDLPFARRKYRSLREQIDENDEEIDDEEIEDAEEVKREEYDEEEEEVEDTSRNRMRSESRNKESTGLPTQSTNSPLSSKSKFSPQRQIISDQCDRRFKKWPKEGPPKFPKVIPFEIVKDCNDDLPDTEGENEDDFPYWLDQWVQKH